MEPPEFSAGGSPSPTRRQLQGPRPTQLRVRKESYTIKKPPLAPPPSHAPASKPPPRQTGEATTQNRQPVIIYAVSPKVIHTTESDFMSLVQRLTGSSSTSGDLSAVAASGEVSPAARLASVERTNPKEREKDRVIANDLMDMVEGVEWAQIPGILSPAPATLQPISPGFFSPGADLHVLSLLHDLSPLTYGNNMFMPSPSTLFSTPIVSPSPSSFDLFNQFLNF